MMNQEKVIPKLEHTPVNVMLFINIRDRFGFFTAKYDIFKITEAIISDLIVRPYPLTNRGYSNVFIHPFVIGNSDSVVDALFERANRIVPRFLALSLSSTDPELAYDGSDKYSKPAFAVYTNMKQMYILSSGKDITNITAVVSSISLAYERSSWFGKYSFLYEKYMERNFIPKLRNDPNFQGLFPNSETTEIFQLPELIPFSTIEGDSSNRNAGEKIPIDSMMNE